MSLAVQVLFRFGFNSICLVIATVSRRRKGGGTLFNNTRSQQGGWGGGGGGIGKGRGTSH